MYITPVTLYQVSATNPDPCFAVPKVNSVQLTQARIPSITIDYCSQGPCRAEMESPWTVCMGGYGFCGVAQGSQGEDKACY